MKVKTAARGIALLAFALTVSTAARAQQPAVTGAEAYPFVDISLLGSDVIFRPQRLTYRVTADPGSYVTVILISPRGTRTLLDPSGRMVEGTKRGALFREAWSGSAPGESYIIAIATRDKDHSTNLVRRAPTAFHFASRFYSAEASLNELLTSLLPSAGNDFSAAFLSFRILSSGFPRTLAYGSCAGSLLLRTDAMLSDDYYYQSLFDGSIYDELDGINPFGYNRYAAYATGACEDRRLNRPVILASAPLVPIPIRPPDTTTAIDSVPNRGRGDGPIVHRPAAPRPLDVQPFVDGAVRAVPMEDPRPGLPVTRPVPVQEERREAVPLVLAPRTDPIVPVERPVPVSQPVPMERHDPPPPPRTSPTPLPDATGSGPAIPPPIL